MKVWSSRGYAERNKLFMEEWLTDFRTKLLKKCQSLLAKEYIVNVKTKDGEIVVFYNDRDDGQLKKIIVVTQERGRFYLYVFTNRLRKLNSKA